MHKKILSQIICFFSGIFVTFLFILGRKSANHKSGVDGAEEYSERIEGIQSEQTEAIGRIADSERKQSEGIRETLDIERADENRIATLENLIRKIEKENNINED